VRQCYAIPLKAIQEQLEAIFEDIPPDSIKIGMLFTASIVNLVADFLEKHAQRIPIVLDPVMVAKSGDYLLLPDAITVLKKRLIPLASIITPNLEEAAALTKVTQDMHAQAEAILAQGAKAVLIKGGHQQGPESNDLYLDQQQSLLLKSNRITSKNTHGTGCTLSAAIAAYLAKGKSLIEACQCAKDYLFGALSAAQYNSVGHGHGPVHHFYNLWTPDEA
jgi:hydroxymethylpyrimidine/phosphomethylpyrimidine kinase